MSHFGVYFTDILKELCHRVKIKFEDVDFSEDDWYLRRSWTQEQQDDFIDWFSMRLANRGVRNEICKYPSLVKTVDQRKKFAKQFVDQFGWQIKE